MKYLVQKHASFILNWSFNPIIIKALKNRNMNPQSLKTIKKIDADWIKNDNLKLKKELQTNEVGKFLKDKIINNQLYTEAFLCDKKGAIVGLYPVTTDYWQGDEDKFIKSYNSGQGTIFYGPLRYDKSAKAHSIQVSVPVKDWNETIGVLIFGIKNLRIRIKNNTQDTH